MDLILGTAGHIDHGKTSLIRALTGTDTTHLPEERKRGITIEPGYAVLELPGWRLGIVDVPGHEKFVRQMLAGAAGMDLALLVVAADDSVKPQTREHFEILKILRLRAGVVAITKTDLVHPDWLALVEEEVRELVRGSFLENAPIVPVSSVTGVGLPELREALAAVAAVAATAVAAGAERMPFRMAIDRCFAREGFGTVVTGTVGSGAARVGDSLEVQPRGIAVRIRGLQNHGQDAELVRRGQRAAINLAGIHHQDVRRGDELVAAGAMIPARRLLVELEVLADTARPLRDRERVRLHLGTAELPAIVRLAKRKELAGGGRSAALLLLPEPAVSAWDQPLVLRLESPAMTIAGGRVLHSGPAVGRRLDEDDIRMAAGLASHDAARRAAAAVWFGDPLTFHPARLAYVAGVREGDGTLRRLVDEGEVREIALSNSRMVWLHIGRWNRLGSTMLQRLERMHDREPLKPAFPLASLLSALQPLAPPEVLRAVLADLVSRREIRRQGDTVQRAGRGPQLTRNEQAELQAIVARAAEAGLEGPSVRELQAAATRARDSVPQLVGIAVAAGDLVLIGQDLILHPKTVAALLDRIRSRWPPPARFTVSELREFLGTSRKYAVPLCEYLDAAGWTVRDGDQRSLRDG